MRCVRPGLFPFACVAGIIATGLLAGAAVAADSRPLSFRPVEAEGRVLGFDVFVGDQLVAPIRLSSNGLITAARAERLPGKPGGLRLSGLAARSGVGLSLAPDDFVEIRCAADAPWPEVRFRFTVAAFDARQWEERAGRFPFHFLTLSMADAEVVHQRGWLNATPQADPFPLLIDPHAGTPEIAAKWSRNWSYAVPLGAYPLPVLGLWAPEHKLYAAYDFMPSRLTDQSERYLAGVYCWREGADRQFVCLAYPHGGRGFQTLDYPRPGTSLPGRFRLVYSTNLPATDDPNTLLQEDYFRNFAGQFPAAPPMNDLGWMPGGTRLTHLPGAPGGSLIYVVGPHDPYEEPGNIDIGGWTWHRESAVFAAYRRNDQAILHRLKQDIAFLVDHVRRVTIDGDECMYWEKPVVGRWRDTFGGDAVTTLHNSNGWAAGIALVDFYRHDHTAEYLPLIDGIYNWTRHFVWTRNEFADVPSSPFAIGGTLSAAFLLDYHRAFHGDPQRRDRAREALELARKITYRYLIAWAADNDRDDRLDATFLWEPNSGRDWTGAACANEVHWNLDTLTQVYVNCGDPILHWYLRGALERWHLLYRDMSFDTLADYPHEALSEWLGLFDDTMAGRGARANFGTGDILPLHYPPGDSLLRVTCGQRAAFACCKAGMHSCIEHYRYATGDNFSFTVRSTRRDPFDVTVSFPFADLQETPVRLHQGASERVLSADELRRSPSSPSYVYVRGVRDGDTLTFGSVPANAPELRLGDDWTAAWGTNKETASGPWCLHAPALDEALANAWDDTNSFAGLWPGRHDAWGIPFHIAADAAGQPRATGKPVAIDAPAACQSLYVFFAPHGPQAAVKVAAPQGLVTRTIADGALAWVSWPLCFHQKIAVVEIPLAKSGRVTISPADASILAVTSVTDQGEQRRIAALLSAGNRECRAVLAQEAATRSLREALASVPADRIAILPTAKPPAGPVVNLLGAVGLIKRCRQLKAAELLDPQWFNAQRFPVLLNLDGEDYQGTVHRPGDGVEALRGYLRSGGLLAMLTSLPLPFCYDVSNGGHVPHSLTAQLGFPVGEGFEHPPADDLQMTFHSGQPILTGLPASLPFLKEGDLRLRVVHAPAVVRNADYTPLVTVYQPGGKVFGDAAAFAQFTRGEYRGARVLYIWSGLLSDPRVGTAMGGDALRFLAQQVKAAEH